MHTLFTAWRTRLWWLLLIVASALASCGGSMESSATMKFTSVAMAGELLDYTLDPVNLTYTYTITDSQFGLNGKTGSGTLTRNLDGSYSPSGAPNVRIVILPNGLLLGAVRERFGTAVVTVPIIGLSNPVSTVSSLAGTYNYMHRGCVTGVCFGLVGTFTIAANGGWSSCPGANPGAAACPAGGHSGMLNPLGNGRWQVMDGSTEVGTAIGFNSGGQNVLLIDLKDQRTSGGFGIGIVVGSQQALLTAGQTDGTWIAGTTGGNWAVFTASGTTTHVSSFDGVPVDLNGSFTANAPWLGMATGSGGGVGFLAGTGVYVLETANGYAEIGVKLR